VLLCCCSAFAAIQNPPSDPPSFIKGDVPRQFTKVISASHSSYEIRVAGLVDGINTKKPEGYFATIEKWQPNQFIRIENTGTQNVVNPRIYANNQGPWQNIAQMVQQAIRGANTPEEKARAVYEFVRHQVFHGAMGDNRDPVRILNGFGYSLCGGDTNVLRILWGQLGIQNRGSGAIGHVTAEAFYNNSYHLFDADTNAVYLLRDNHTIASQTDLVRDHDLIKRTHALSITMSEDRKQNEIQASRYAMKLEYLPGGIFAAPKS